MRKINKQRATQLIKKGAVLVDMRSPVAFRDGHVSGAINQTLKAFLNYLVATKDKKTNIIIYSNGVDLGDVEYATKYADQLSFSNVYVSDYQTLR